MRYSMFKAEAESTAYRSFYRLVEIFSPGRISMTQEERTNLITGFLAANAGKTDENTARMLNMLVESLAYSKLQELLPEMQKRNASDRPQPETKKKLYLKFTKKEIEQMNGKFKNMRKA